MEKREQLIKDKYTSVFAKLSSNSSTPVNTFDLPSPIGVSILTDGRIRVSGSGGLKNLSENLGNATNYTPSYSISALRAVSGDWITFDHKIGNASDYIGGSQSVAIGKFSNPTGIVVDNEGVVYVSDSGNKRIQRFTPFSPVTSYKQFSIGGTEIMVAKTTSVKKKVRLFIQRVLKGEKIQVSLNLLPSGTPTTIQIRITSSNPLDIIKSLFNAIIIEQQSDSIWDNVVASFTGEAIEIESVTTDDDFDIHFYDLVDINDSTSFDADANGNLYITDPSKTRVIKLGNDSSFLSSVGAAHFFNELLIKEIRFDETSGIICPDSSGIGSNGTGTSSLNWSTSGRTGNAVELNGTNQLIEVAASSTTDNPQAQRTYEIWFKVSDKGKATEQVIFKQGIVRTGL